MELFSSMNVDGESSPAVPIAATQRFISLPVDLEEELNQSHVKESTHGFTFGFVSSIRGESRSLTTLYGGYRVV